MDAIFGMLPNLIPVIGGLFGDGKDKGPTRDERAALERDKVMLAARYSIASGAQVPAPTSAPAPGMSETMRAHLDWHGRQAALGAGPGGVTGATGPAGPAGSSSLTAGPFPIPTGINVAHTPYDAMRALIAAAHTGQTAATLRKIAREHRISYTEFGELVMAHDFMVDVWKGLNLGAPNLHWQRIWLLKQIGNALSAKKKRRRRRPVSLQDISRAGKAFARASVNMKRAGFDSSKAKIC